MNKISRFDLISLGLLILISILSLASLGPFPQFLDGYYHLSAANGFIQSGGWTGWDWWSFAPFGRPHLYPPLYHLILIFLESLGITQVNSLKFTEAIITPLFFFVVWFVLRKIVNDRFSFINLLTLSSFLPFYASISDNIPASLAIIFGLLSWLFVIKRNLIKAILPLSLSFYTHSSISWVFLFSFLLAAFFSREHRRHCLKITFASLFLAIPILYHQIIHLNYITLEILGEVEFIRFSIFIISLGLISLFLHFRKKDLYILLFWGYFVGSIIIFIKYPYRFFSAQGIIGLAFFSSLFFERLFSVLSNKKANIVMAVIIPYLFFSHAAFGLNKEKFKLKIFDSTYYNLLTGKIYRYFKFTPIIIPKLYNPIFEVIKANTTSFDIISSNENICAQIFSALTQRPASNAMLGEIKSRSDFSRHQYAKLIIWLKLTTKDEFLAKEGINWKKIYENDIAYVFLNLDYKPSIKVAKSNINFKFIFFTFLLVLIFFFKDNLERI